MSTNENEGPLAKLNRLLGIANDLPAIEAVKRIDVMPRRLNIPEDFTNTEINAFVANPETIFNVPKPKRAFDLHYEYTSFAPPNQRWSCIDLNTYDGAPDSEAPSTFIGRGANEGEARGDLLGQFHEYDHPEPAPRARIGDYVSGNGNDSPFERDEPKYVDPDEDDGVTFDDDLEPSRE